MMRNFVMVIGAGLLLVGCTKPSEPVAPVAKPVAKAMPTMAPGADTVAAPAPATEAVAPPPGAAAAPVSATVPAAGVKVIVPGSADDPNMMPVGFVPKAVPRQYVVNGQVDLNALSEALRDYCMWKKSVPADVNELVTSKYLPTLPEAPAGKKYSIDRSQLAVTLVNK